MKLKLLRVIHVTFLAGIVRVSKVALSACESARIFQPIERQDVRRRRDTRRDPWIEAMIRCISNCPKLLSLTWTIRSLGTNDCSGLEERKSAPGIFIQIPTISFLLFSLIYRKCSTKTVWGFFHRVTGAADPAVHTILAFNHSIDDRSRITVID